MYTRTQPLQGNWLHTDLFSSGIFFFTLTRDCLIVLDGLKTALIPRGAQISLSCMANIRKAEYLWLFWDGLQGPSSKGLGRGAGVERLVHWLGTPIPNVCLWASPHTRTALSLMHFILAKTCGWWWELKERYQSVCVGFQYTEVDILSSWHVRRTSRKATCSSFSSSIACTKS